ncbi:MAG: hypothetical protein HUK20_13305 [Fibrobacter sp.]|nr:hypothetical protein [Fibrobacter sp.]
MLKGKKWSYVPKFNSAKCRLGDFVLIVLTSASMVLPVGYLLRFLGGNVIYALTVVPVALVACIIMCVKVKANIAEIFRLAFYVEYRKVRYAQEVKGAGRNEADIQNRTIWSFTKKMKNAEAHKRLRKYVRLMANTKKLPPELYTEITYV